MRRASARAVELALDNWTVRRGNYAHPLEPMIAEHFGGAGFEFIGRGMVKVPNDPGAPLTAAALFWMPCGVGAPVEVDRETERCKLCISWSARGLRAQRQHGRLP